MSWSDVINQEHISRVLQMSLKSGRLAHAYLFAGPDGAGKYFTALEFAKALNCESATAGDACDRCESCRKITALQHPNVHLVMALPVGKNEKYGDDPYEKLSDDEMSLIQEQLRLKAENPYHRIVIPRATGIKVNSVREIRRESSLAAFERGRKIFIILDAEQMSAEAANSLLKTLEEPHDDTFLILTSSRPDQLLQTILSRCQLLRFIPLSEEHVADALVKKSGLEPPQAMVFARISQGNFAKALEFAGSPDLNPRDEATALLRTLVVKSHEELLEEIDRIAGEKEREEIVDLLAMVQEWLREAMIFREGIDVRVADPADAVRKFAGHYVSADYISAIEAIDRSISLIGKNVYIPLIILDLAFQLRDSLVGNETGKT